MLASPHAAAHNDVVRCFVRRQSVIPVSTSRASLARVITFSPTVIQDADPIRIPSPVFPPPARQSL